MTWKKIISMVLLLCTLMSMFAMPAVGAASVDTAQTGAQVNLASVGANVSDGTVIYFDASNVAESGAVIQFMIGHGSWSQGYPMTKVSNSNLYYVKMPLWEGASEYAIFGCNEEWGGEGSSVTSRKAWAPWSTSVLSATDLSGTVILTANSSGTLSKSSASLNTTQTATACYQSTGGGSYSTGTTGGTVKVSGYTVSGTTGTSKSSSTSGSGISSGIGTSVTMTATAATGYTFKGWFTSTTATSATSTSATYTYTNTGSAKTLYAKFQLNGPYTVTVQTNSTSYGTVSTASSSVYWGKTTTLTATPKTGYHLSSWAITSGSGTLSSTTALKPTLTVKGNVTAKATFAANTGKVTFSAGTGGSVSSTGGSTTYSGTKASTASASTGYYFTGWTISGGTLNTDYKITSGSTSSASITIQPITQNASITCKANFAAQYKITTQVNYPVLGSVTKSTTYVTPGNTVTIEATATTGNTFNKWTFPSGSYSYTSGNSTSTSITIKPTSNVTVQGNFNAGLNVTAGSNGSVSPSGKSYHGYDTAVTITATPNTGYHFTGWTFGGTYGGSPSTSSASTTIRVRNNTTAKASFAINTYTVTFKDWDGTVIDTKTVNHGSSATAPSNPTRKGYEFTGWSGTYTNVTANQTVTATYKDVQYYLMGDMNSWGGTVMSESGNIASVTVHLEPGTYGFKITKDGTWWGNDGTIVDTTLNTSSVGWEMYTSAGDCKLQAFGGSYTFNFNKSTGFLEVLYDPDRFTVSFFNWDGTLLQSGVVMKGKNATPPANPTKAGDAQYSYTFSGWDKAYTNVQSTLDIHAQFTQTTNKYTVTFKNWDGTVLSTQSVAYGSAATKPSNPTRPATAQYSYTFTGWDKDFSNITGNLTVTAQYSSTVNKYTVTFKNWDGTVLSTQTVAYGSSATAPANPTRPATAQYTYTFSKWDTSYTNITGNTTVTAVYTSTVNKYTVTFKNHDGTVLGTSTVNYGSAATYTGATPTKPATAQYTYTFSGWDKAITNITGNLTVTAQFTQTVNKYTVTFKNWDGTVLSTQSIAYGSSATAPANPTRPATAQYTYTFSKWDKDFSNITGNLTVTAQYSSTVNKYTVTFKNWDGTVLSTQSIAYGSSATAPATPTRPATAQYTYTFSKWDTSYTNITGNTTVTAVYTATVNKYTVTFKNWDGSTIATKSVEYGSAATAPSVPAREGFEFTGWDKDFSNITGNLTVTAQYIDSKVYLLGSFNNWATDTIMTTKSGDIVSTMLILDPGEYTFKILHKDVWYGNYGTIEDTTVTTSDVGWEMVDGANDCVLKASGGSYTFNYNTSTRMLEVIFESDRRTVTFVNWDGTVLKKESVKEGTDATAPSNPTRPADAQYTYTFSGWDKAFTNVTTDLTVTAQYSTTVNKYTVTFKNWDGTVLSTQSIAYGSSATAPATPTRPATAQYTYTFSGWDKDFSKITGDLTVTAQYTSTVNKYTVTFKNWDGTVLSTQSIAYGSSATAPATPTRPATAQYTYTFSKWDTSYTNITGNTTVTAVYTSTVNKYTVKFVDWDGSTLATRTVEYGSAATAPADPTRANYAFTGWDKDFSNITGNLTVTAQYVDTRVYIPGSFNGWATDTPLATKSGDIVTTTLRIEAGTYQFKVLHKDVWYGNSGTIADTTTATSSIGWEMSALNGDNCTLQASGGTYTFNYNTATHFLEILYTPDTYTVTFVNWDGSTLKTETVISGKSATAPANPTREATAQYTYTFKGWDKEFTNVTSNLTVTAQYTETLNKYTVTFKGWDGSVLATRTVEYGKSATAPTAPARAGYEFTGWDTDFSNVTGNITVTAQYIDARVYLVGDFNNWGVDTILTTTSGNIVSTTLRIEESSYAFKILYKDTWYGNNGTIEDTTTATSSIGWEMAIGAGNCTLQASGGTYTFNYNTETRMLEVLYAPDSYTVVFKNWDGTVLSTQSVVEGSAAKAPQTPTRAATAQYTYTFKAWDTDFSNVTSDLVVTATYTQTLNKYTVTFKNWDGTILNTQSVEYGKSATAPSTPTRPADAQYTYTFKAWDKSFTNITGDLTVTATYSSALNKYTVTFVNWDGTELSKVEVEYGKAATAPTVPAREGYEFKSWDKDFTNITGDLTVTAQFTDVQIYLLGDFNGWATDTVMTTTTGNIVSTTLQLTAGEYKFKITTNGIWYGNNGIIEDTTITSSAIGWEMVDGYGDCTLKATGGAYTFNFNTETRMLEVLFESDSFTVTFKDWDGTILKTESVKAGQSATAPADPARAADAQYTYTFAGWDTDFTNIQEATTITATYTQTLNKYTVTFKDHDGTVLDTQQVEYGKSATAPADPTREGFEFTGWDKDFSNITADITVTAQYSSKKIYLLGSFNNWEQKDEMTASTGNIVSVTLDLEPGTYIFKILAGDNWYGNWGNIEDTTTKTSDIGWEMTTDAGDCTLTASGGKYTFNFNTETKMLEVLSEVGYFTVTFVNWDGTVLKTESVKKGASATAPTETPARAADAQYSYTFAGWDGSFTNVQAATTVTATYTKTLNKYTVTFVNWDGTEISSQQVEYGSAATAPKDPTREGTEEITYTFAGWDKDFSNITGDTVVTATYTSSGSVYTVTFVNYDGTVLKTETVSYGLGATAPEDPTRDGDAQYSYTFAGWDKSFDSVTSDITVTATYVTSTNTYTVTFVNYDGSVLKTQQVAYGAAATAPVNPTRPTTSQYIFTFDGWDKAFNYITGDLTVKATYTAKVNSGGTSSNIYNLSSEVQKGQILQCWNWSYNNIKYHMQDIASQGFSAIQTSPVQATKETTKEYYNTVWNSSWVVYQPVSFTMETNSFNALGTKAEFEAMCAEAHKYGIKVIVDVVFNHMANDMSENTIHPWVPADLRENADCWHDISKNIYDFGNRYDVTHYCLTGLPDLNTANSTVQWHCTNLLKECIAAGADGFRIDAAKHIETDWDADGIKSDFWYNVLGAATAYAQSTRGFTPYYYGEFIGAPEGIGIDAYTRYMSVTDTGANSIREAVCSGNASAAASSGITYGEAASKAVLWTESHDNFKDNGTRFISDHNINKTWALVGSRAEACGLYLARPSNIETTLMGAADVTSWSYPEVRAINQFKNHFVGQGEYLSSYNSLACVERGTTGMVIVNVGGTYYNGMSAPVHTMQEGVYSDAITGNTFTVSGGYITGDIGDTGIAVVYRVGDNGPFTAGNPTEVSLVGSFNNWDASSHVFVANNKQTATTTLFLEAGTYTFKITTSSGLWYGNAGTITDTTGNTPWSMYANVSDNCTLQASGGRYTFTFDSTTGKLSVEHQSTYDYNSTVYLKGSFNEWGTSNQMTYTGQNNIVTTTVTLEEGTYTFKLNNTGAGAWYGNTGTIYDTTATSAASGWVMSTSVNDNCTLVASGGTYTFNFNLSTNQLIVLYTPPTYKVTFVDWDGTVLSEQTVQKGQAASAPVSPTRESDGTYTYTFTGWDKTFNNITGDTVVTAQYTTAENVYTVTFVDYDGIVLYYQVVTKGEDATAPEDPVRMGNAQYSYEFAGWDGDYTNVQSDITITATYKETVNEYTVTFKDYDGTVITTQQVAYGSAAEAPADPTREGNAQYTYTFKGWDVDFSEIKAELTVTATYTETVNKYTVIFLDHDGTELKSQTVEYGTDAEAPADPTRAGYVFTGWDKTFGEITEDITVYAQYAEDIVYVYGSFNDWTDSTKMTATETDGVVTATVELEAGTYKFKIKHINNWYGNTGVIEDTTLKTSDIGWEMVVDTDDCTLQASGGFYTFTFNKNTRMLEITFVSATHTVTFLDRDGNVIDEVVVDHEGEATAPEAPQVEGYLFAGWDKDITCVTEDMTVTATYVEATEEYTVTFVNYDGTVLYTQTVKAGESAEAPTAPTRDKDDKFSYTFKGWDKDFSRVVGDMTVTATFTETPHKFTVIFLDHDGTELSKVEVEYGKSAEAPETPAREGYVFIGWDKDITEITEDITVTAQYKEASVFLMGSFNDWQENTLMTEGEEAGIVSVTVNLEAGTYYFKIKNIDTWFGNTGTIEDTTLKTSDIGWEMVVDTDDCTLVATGGTYTFNFNTETNMLEVLFTPPSYTVKFVDYDGTVIEEVTVVRGEDAKAPADPVRAGYKFISWEGDFTNVQSDLTITALYIQIKITYTVTFLDFDGTVLKSQIVTTGEAAEAPEDPTREYYTFLGWDKDFSNITYNLTVNALYQDTRSYLTGSFNDWSKDTVMTENGNIVSTEMILKAGTYSFKLISKDTWFTNTGIIEDTTLKTSDIGWEMVADQSIGDCTLKASGGKYTFNFNMETKMLGVIYTPMEYTVTFVDYDGTVLKEQKVMLGEDAEAPEVSNRNGFYFTGWDKEFENIESDLTVNAVYIPNDTTYTVTFVGMDGTIIETQQVGYGQDAVAPEAPQVDGYVFVGWSEKFSSITGEKTITALYEEDIVYIFGSFNDWAEGIKMTAGEGVHEYTLTLGKGTYYFKLSYINDWFGNTGAIDDTTLATSDIGWEMVLDADNCTLNASGGEYTFRYNTETKMLEIIYTPLEYTVVFKDKDGKVLSETTVKLGDTVEAPEAPAVEGFIFVGWDKDFENIAEDLEINAVYIEDDTKYTVTFVDMDGTVLYTQYVEYGEAAEKPADPTRVGYIFTGWDKDFSKITGDTVITAEYKDNQIYLVGTFNDWQTDISLRREGSTNIFSTMIDLEAGSYFFKLLQNDVWYTNASTILDTTKVTSDTGIELRTDTSLGDIILNASGGTYEFKFNVETNELVVIFYAGSIQKYTVTFVNWDGTVIDTLVVASGKDATAPADPTREGDAQYSYIFAGWDRDFTNVTEDLTVTAKYTTKINEYTVIFTDKDGNVLDTQTVEYGKSATAPAAPTVDGYVFKGWDKDFSKVTGDITVAATYQKGVASNVTLAGTFNGWDASASPFLITDNKDKVSLQMKLEEGTYQFKVVENGSWYGNWGTIADTTITTSATGWVMDASAGDCTLITSGGTYVFTYTISTHTLEVTYLGSEFKVTFVDWDGTVIKTEVVEPGGSATAPTGTFTRPADDGYTYVFAGWDQDFTNVIAPLRVNAVYTATPKMYTVTFVDWNGALLKSQRVAYGTAATPPADPVRSGYIFSGWDGDIWYITGNTTFRAQYSDNGVYIMGDFNDWQGTKLSHIGGNVYQGSIYLAAGQYKFKVKQGYDWFGNNGWIDDTTTYTSDVGWEMSWDAGDCTLNASGSTYTFRYNTSTRMLEVLYVAPTYTVVFKDWNGATLKTQYVKRGNPAYAPANPSRAGYIFTGWDRDFGWIYENTTVTAQYALNTVSVMGDFNNWEGTGMAPAGGTMYTATIELQAGTYKFKIKHADTWYGNGGTIENSTLATSAIGWEMVWDQGDCTLNATGGTYTFNFNTETRMLEILYKGQVYTVTFVDYDGSIISTQQVEYGKSATAPANPVREGFEFSGWSGDFSFITGNTTIMAQYGGETVVYLRGTFNNWDMSSPMRGTETPKVYTYVLNLAAGSYTFKINIGDVWYGNSGTIEETTLNTSETGWDMDATAGDCTLNALGGTYLFRFNTETNKLEILRVTDEFTVTFKDYDGKVLSEVKVKYGEAAQAPEAPTRNGYVFAGWDQVFDNVTGDMTVTAMYKKTVVLNGYTPEATTDEMILTEGSSAYEVEIELEEGEFNFEISYGGEIYSLNTTFAEYTEGITLVTGAGKIRLLTFGGIYKFIFDTDTKMLRVVKLRDASGDEVIPDTPATGDEPEIPDTPSTGDEPEIPDTPSTGDEPENPDTPVVPEEPVIKEFLVVYVNTDGKFLGYENVIEGQAAVNAPVASYADEYYTYTFIGWDKSLNSVTSDMVVTALYLKVPNTYTVIFTDYDGRVLKKQTVAYSKSATAPNDPTREGYVFRGWDKDFTDVRADMTVTAKYSKVVEAATEGTLRIEIAGGTNFRISVNGGAARPQGTSYLNTQMPIAATVTVTAGTTNSNTFIGWMNDKGLIVSNEMTYTFVTTGNDYYRAMFSTDVENAVFVVFKNDKANQLIDAQYYVAGDAIEFPDYPTHAAFIVTGWSMTAEEIQAAIAAGESVVVVPKWEKKLVYVQVTVTNGSILNASADNKYVAYSQITATANAASAGKKFAYWIDQNGNIVSYKEVYSFYPSENVSITAVYVKDTAIVDYNVILSVKMDTSSDDVNINTVILSWEVPENSGITFVQAGALLVEESKYDANTFYKGTTDSNVTKWTPGSVNQIPTKTITVNKKGVEIGSTWVIQGWITYIQNGETVTIYTDLQRVTK